MPEIELLAKPLKPEENVALDTLDPRFQEVVTLVQSGDYGKAGPKIENMFRENIYDIRVIGFYIYWVFEETGMAGLLNILKTLNFILTENWKAIGPLEKKERHAIQSLLWLFSQLNKIFQYHEKKKDPKWEAWVEQSTSEYLQEIMDTAGVLRKSLSMAIPEGSDKTLDQILKFSQWLTEFQKLVYAQKPPAQEAPPSEQQKTEEENKEAKGRTPDETREKNIQGQGRQTQSQEGLYPGSEHEFPYVEGSYHLQQLILKLKAFESLIQKEELAKAALVADDITNIISNFDPTVYLPKLFSTYFRLLSVHINEIAGFLGEKETPAWQAMEKLYKVDLDGFVNI